MKDYIHQTLRLEKGTNAATLLLKIYPSSVFFSLFPLCLFFFLLRFPRVFSSFGPFAILFRFPLTVCFLFLVFLLFLRLLSLDCFCLVLFLFCIREFQVVFSAFFACLLNLLVCSYFLLLFLPPSFHFPGLTGPSRAQVCPLFRSLVRSVISSSYSCSFFPFFVALSCIPFPRLTGRCHSFLALCGLDFGTLGPIICILWCYVLHVVSHVETCLCCLFGFWCLHFDTSVAPFWPFAWSILPPFGGQFALLVASSVMHFMFLSAQCWSFGRSILAL